ncbi:putative lipoprotein [Bacteriovorax sp. BAL6_X]|uniref:hypothetical protein n=1 Tax=Bacteriovorax sp. BAL6_X TaxID=1201290 RepID=UPI000386B72C|nr:hypothetical protein [Bacteriovorax sp. BAL6_X]EPZ49935.1 putative lipoprotein [Bacteriovorax sp. BAL6_X]
MKKIIILLFILTTITSCVSEDDLDTALAYCPTGEDISGPGSTINITAGQRVAQELSMNGIIGATVYMDRIRLFMSSENLSSVSVKVYKDIEESHSHTPDDGTLVGAATLTSGLGSADPATEHDLYFSSPVPFQVGKTYYLIVDGVGGDFSMSITTPGYLPTSRINIYNGSNWTSPYGYDPNISFDVYYSHCTGI